MRARRFIAAGLISAACLGFAAAPRMGFAPAFRLQPKTLAANDPTTPEGLAALIDKFSSPLLGRPYANGPLGEGEGKDADPLYRLDVFDCTTFIETILANALCARAGERMPTCLEEKMRRIRYAGGKIGFDSRNHVPELDWLPNNVEEGFLKDVTGSLFPGLTRKAKVTMDRTFWLASQRPDPPGAKAEESGKAAIRDISYIPTASFFAAPPFAPEALAALEKTQMAASAELEKKLESAASPAAKEELTIEKFRVEMDYLKQILLPIEARLNAIPNGSVLNLVRGNISDEKKAKLTPLIIHQGLILQKADGAYIRHAAPNIGHVSEQKLVDYLIRYVKSPKARGITVYKVLPLAQGK